MNRRLKSLDGLKMWGGGGGGNKIGPFDPRKALMIRICRNLI